MAYKLPLNRWTKLEDCLNEKEVTYYFPKDRNDGFMYKTGSPDGLSKFHIHSIEEVAEDDMIFRGLLAKSGNWRSGEEPNLAEYPIDQWQSMCKGMDSSTLSVVQALSDCFRKLGVSMV